MDPLDMLEERVTELERKLLGAGGATADKRQLVQELLQINEKLSNLSNNRPKVKEAFSKLEEIHSYAEPDRTVQLLMPLNIKMRVIEANGENVQRMAHQMELIQESQSVLDSEHIRAAPSHASKLAEVGQNQSAGALEVADHTTQVSELITSYNQSILLLNKQFAYWNQLLTKLEMQKA